MIGGGVAQTFFPISSTMTDSTPGSTTKRKNTGIDREKNRRFRSVGEITVFTRSTPCSQHPQDGSSIWTKPVVSGPGVWVSCTKGNEKQAIGEVYQIFELVHPSFMAESVSHGWWILPRLPRMFGRRPLRMTTKNVIKRARATEVRTLRRKLRKNLRRSSVQGKSGDSVGRFLARRLDAHG